MAQVFFVIDVLLVVIIAVILLTKLYLHQAGTECIVVKMGGQEEFKLEHITDKTMDMSCELEIANIGKQCGTIMDCFVRQQLPYEQYDGVQVTGKAELKGAPREDDYFESVLIEKGESICVLVRVSLTARKGLPLKQALQKMVDLPLDVLYTETGRHPWKISKVRLVIPAEKIASLAGVDLVKD